MEPKQSSSEWPFVVLVIFMILITSACIVGCGWELLQVGRH